MIITFTSIMDSCVRGGLWIILVHLFVPHATGESVCPSGCLCTSEGAVKCVGSTVTDIPKDMPVHTNFLQLNVTKMHIINEQSLENLPLLLRFGLTFSHLHTIHPEAFRVAPQLKSVKLSVNDLSTIPTGVFSPLTVLEQLHLDGNQLETIAPDMFQGLDGLRNLDLNRNKLSNLTSDVFNGLTNLTFLNLGRNYIKKLPPTIFHSLIQLSQLMIYNNELEQLEPGMFDTLINLEELKIHYNQISSIPPKVFWPLKKLNTLTLSTNQLQAVPEKSFYHMPKLTWLTLYKNSLLSLPDQLMGYVPDMREFYLFTTNLTTVPGNLFANMSGLRTLNFHLNSRLRDLPSDLFCCLPNLQKLSLRSNDLQYVPPDLFSRLTNLEILLLNHNKLQNIPKDIFHGLSLLSTIDLRNNHLKMISGDLFSTNRALTVVSLRGNLWDCTCNIRSIVRWIKENEHLVPDRDDAICHSPVYQVLRTLSSLNDEEFEHCDVIRLKGYSPTHKLFHGASPKTVVQPLSTITQTSTTTTRTTTTKTTTTLPKSAPRAQWTSQQETMPTTTAPIILTTPFVNIASTTEKCSFETEATPASNISPPFYGKLVFEQGPEYVHHSIHNGWVYVWYLPSDMVLTGFLMFCHILFVLTGLSLVVAAFYGMQRLSKIMDKFKAECVHIQV